MTTTRGTDRTAANYRRSLITVPQPVQHTERTGIYIWCYECHREINDVAYALSAVARDNPQERIAGTQYFHWACIGPYVRRAS